MLEVKKIYQRWLEGGLAPEDALFAIGDVLSGATAGSRGGAGRPADGVALFHEATMARQLSPMIRGGGLDAQV